MTDSCTVSCVLSTEYCGRLHTAGDVGWVTVDRVDDQIHFVQILFLRCHRMLPTQCWRPSVTVNTHRLTDLTHCSKSLHIGELLKLCVKIRPDSWLVCCPFRCHREWRHEWQHGGLCAFRHSFGCVLLLDQIFRKQCTVRQYTTLIYLINLLGKLVLGLWLDSRVALF